MQIHVNLNFKVVRQGHAYGSMWHECPGPGNIRKNKMIKIALTRKFNLGVILKL